MKYGDSVVIKRKPCQRRLRLFTMAIFSSKAEILLKSGIKTLMIAALAVALLCPAIALARDPIETEKILYLIASVENLPGARLIRNGKEHDGKEAGEHLRMKLRRAGNKVQTAEDFITYCASGSSMSGKPYLIRFSNGTTEESGVFFRAKLQAFKKRDH